MPAAMPYGDPPSGREPRFPLDDQREPNSPNTEDQEFQFLPVTTLRSQYLDYLATKTEEIEEQKNARRYYHGAQLTAEQLRVLRERHQPPQVWNRVARKINGIVGLAERMRSDPKAEPSSPSSEQSADIATHVIREILSANEWKSMEPWCLLQAGIDGICGVQFVLEQGDKGDVDVGLHWTLADEYFYDPTSVRYDRKDCDYEGVSRWISLDRAIAMFPDKEDLLTSLIEGDSDLTTNSDRDYKWVMVAKKKLRLCEHWYYHRGEWCWAFYVSTVLLAEGMSPWFDEKGKRVSSFEMFATAVDQDGDVYGFVRNLRDPQDALNQGKSKTLHLANSRRLIMEKGAVDDTETARREWARPDGVVEVNPGKQVKPDDTRFEFTAFAGFTEDAKNEIDQFANVNMAAMTSGPINQLSGRAIELLRQPAMAELGPFVLSIRGWKLRIHRKAWNAAQRYWTKERWIRVTNDQGIKQFLQLNGMGLDQWGRPALVNSLGAIDVNIEFEEGRDVASIMQDVSDQLKGYPPGTFPPQVIIETSDLPRSDKNRILAMLQPKPMPPNPIQMETTRLQLENLAGKNAKLAADTHKTLAGAEQSLATAAEKRAKVGDIAHDADVQSAEFVRDTLLETAKVHRDLNAPAQQPPAGPG